MKYSPPRKYSNTRKVKTFSENISTSTSKTFTSYTSQQIYDLHKDPKMLKKISKMLKMDAMFWIKLAGKNPKLIPDAVTKKLYQALSRYRLKILKGTNFETEWQAAVGAQRYGPRFGRALGIREGEDVMVLRDYGYGSIADIKSLKPAERKILQHIWPKEFGVWMKDKDTFHKGNKKFYPEKYSEGINPRVPSGENYHPSVGWY